MLNLTETHLISATRKYPLPVEEEARPRDQDNLKKPAWQWTEERKARQSIAQKKRWAK